jgi:hypothetical protein
MYLRDENCRKRLVTAFRDSRGKVVQVDLGPASEEGARLVQQELVRKRVQRQKESELKSTVRSLDRELSERWQEVLKQIEPVMAQGGFHRAKSEWRRKRRIFTARTQS